MQNNGFSTNKTLNVQGRLIDLSTPKVMGILNVTPDSFFDGNRYTEISQALKQTEKMLKDGASVVDVGGYSSRPGADDISLAEELRRVLPVVKAIAKEFGSTVISIDTFRSAIAHACVQEGAGIVNDISGGEQDAAMFATVAQLQVPYLLMHMKGTPQTMVQQNHYDFLLKDMIDYFHKRVYQLHAAGVKDVIIDPGFGFAKNIQQNFELLHHMEDMKILGKPILAGLSRKSMIWKSLGITPEEALNGTTSLNTIALLKGASILRVHDVKEAVEVVNLVEKLKAK